MDIQEETTRVKIVILAAGILMWAFLDKVRYILWDVVIVLSRIQRTPLRMDHERWINLAHEVRRRAQLNPEY